MKPNILNPDWKYIPAARTDVAATIRREQKRIADEKKLAEDTLKQVIAKRRVGGA